MVISAAVEALAFQKLTIEDSLREVLRGGHCAGASGVAQAMEYAVLGSGPRLRPLLAVRLGQMLGGILVW